MSDLQKYVENRVLKDAAFAEGYAERYANFKLGILLRQAREAAGLTQEELAARLGTPKSTISKIENRAEDVRLNLLRQYAEALGKNLYIGLT